MDNSNQGFPQTRGFRDLVPYLNTFPSTVYSIYDTNHVLRRIYNFNIAVEPATTTIENTRVATSLKMMLALDLSFVHT